VTEGEAETVRLKDGSSALVRPIAPSDAALVQRLYGEMSERSRRHRFLVPTAELSAEDLEYLTDVDHRRHEALIAVDPDADRAVGLASYVRVPRDREAAEVAVAVVDDWHRRGLATALLDRLTERARENGLVRYTALVSPDNDVVLTALERNGGARIGTTSDGEVEFAIDLPAEGLGERLRSALRAAAQIELIGQALKWLPIGRGRR
jgi:RimJ/RimL family protein N-acetyltransferase